MAIYGPKMKLEMQVIKIVAGKKHNFLPKQILIVQWEQIIICHGLRLLDVFGKREPLICCKSGRIQKKEKIISEFWEISSGIWRDCYDFDFATPYSFCANDVGAHVTTQNSWYCCNGLDNKQTGRLLCKKLGWQHEYRDFGYKTQIFAHTCLVGRRDSERGMKIHAVV